VDGTFSGESFLGVQESRVGVNLCLDLGWIQKLETAASVSGVKLEKLAARLQVRMERFIREAVLIEPR
jgi:hypothetical protein